MLRLIPDSFEATVAKFVRGVSSYTKSVRKHWTLRLAGERLSVKTGFAIWFRFFHREFLLGSKAGVAGFEPTHGGVKVRCLTAWLHPSALTAHALLCDMAAKRASAAVIRRRLCA